jgi:hypothetical protein
MAVAYGKHIAVCVLSDHSLGKKCLGPAQTVPMKKFNKN